MHLDIGSVRHWPRMTHDQLARVFPNGRTVHIPTDGQPLSGYALALADIEKRGGTPFRSLARSRAQSRREYRQRRAADAVNPFAKLFGLGSKSDEDEDADTAHAAIAAAAEPTPAAPRAKAAKPAVVAALERSAEKDKTAANQASGSAESQAGQRRQPGRPRTVPRPHRSTLLPLP